MFNYDKGSIIKLARENDFRSETLEKVLRLIGILKFINEDNYLKTLLVLKGGTAINLFIFDLPRLSVDIDLDFTLDCTKDEMKEYRLKINAIIKRFLMISGYSLSDKSRNTHALDSSIYSYNSFFGNKDNIKIEINYMNRNHLLEPQILQSKINFIDSVNVLNLNKMELFASKIKALIERCTIRDLYDVYLMIINNVFSKSEYKDLRKCVVFYLAIGQTTNQNAFELINSFENKINKFMLKRVPQYVASTLKTNEKFNMIEAVDTVKEFISVEIKFDEQDTEFLESFNNKKYNPKLLFDDKQIIDRIINHPMAKWKVNN